MKKFLSILSKFAIATAVALVFAVPGHFVMPASSADRELVPLEIIAVLLMLAPFVCLTLGLPATFMFVKKKTKNIRKMYGIVDGEMSKIRADRDGARKKLLHMRVLITMYAVLLFLIVSFCTFALANVLPWILVSILVYYGMVYNLALAAANKPDFSEYSSPEDYPALYSLARRAADKVGVEGEIHILMLMDPSGNVGIAKYGKHISLQMGTSMLAILREEELYNILLHEFAHVKNQDTDSTRSHRFISFISYDPSSGPNLFGIIMLLPYTIYTYRFELYTVFASIIVEKEADAEMARLCDRQTAANALYKTAIYGYFQSNIDLYMGRPFHEGEECPSNFASGQVERCLLVLKEKEGFWRDLLSREIQSRGSSHPIFRTRAEELGVENYEFVMPEIGGEYREECKRALDITDKEMYNQLSPNYDEGHKNYLDTLKIVEDWEADGKPYVAERVRDVLFAYVELCRRDEAYALCDEIIEKEGNAGGLCAYAKFMRGNLRCEDYDPRAIEDLYDAANSNNNYIQAAIGRIGELSCALGLEDELEKYRRVAIDYAEKEQNESGTATLSMHDKLEADTAMPPEVFERNLTAIKSAAGDALSRIFLVRKRVTESLHCSSYIVEFKKGTPAETINEAMDKIFQHLDNDPDDLQYSLFLYGKEYAAVVSRVKGSCIYKAEKKV